MIEKIYNELKELSNIGYATYNLEEANRKAQELLSKRKDKSALPDDYRYYAWYVQGLWDLKQHEHKLERNQGFVLPKLFDAAKKGLPEAQYRLAYLRDTAGILKSLLTFDENRKIDEYLQSAIETWEKTPEDANALFHLGKIYAHGVGVEQDPQKAYDYYTKASALKHPMAMNNLAWAIKSGFIPESLYAPEEKNSLVLRLLQKSCEAGNLFAAFNLGAIHLRDLDSTENLTKATKYFEEAQPIWDELMGSLTVHSVDGYFAIGYYNYIQATECKNQEEQDKKFLEAIKFLTIAISTYESLEDEKKENSKTACGNANLVLGVIHEFHFNAPLNALQNYKNAESLGNETARSFYSSLKSDHKKLLKSQKPGYSRLHAYAEQGNIDEIKKFLANSLLKLKIDQKSLSGETSLHFAVRGKLPKAVNQLIDLKADTNAADNLGRTPLHLAADLGHLVVLETLFNSGAKPKTADKDGNIPLYLTAQNGHIRATKFLLENTEYNIGDLKKAFSLAFKNNKSLAPFEEFSHKKTKQTLLHLATDKDDKQFLKQLKKSDIFKTLLEKKDAAGNTPLFTASIKNLDSVVEGFLKAGAIVDEIKSPNGTLITLSAPTPKDILTGHSDLGFISMIDSVCEKSEHTQQKDKYAKIIASLIKQSPQYDTDDIAEKIRACAALLKTIPDPLQKADAIKSFVNPLVHVDLSAIEKGEMGDLKYLALWYQDAGIVVSPGSKRQLSLERAKPEDFLAINIKLLFTSIVENLDKLDQETLNIFIQELCLELDTLRTTRNFIATETQNDSVKEAYYQAQADKILNLKEGETCVFNQGYFGHSIYISFTKEKNQILVRIDNLDDFEHEDYRHERGENNTELLPYLGTLSTASILDAHKAITNYFKKISQARYKNKNEAIPKIYNLPKHGFTVLTRDEIIARNIPARKKQVVNNCVVENFKGGLESRMESKQPGLYAALRNNLVCADAKFHAAQRDRSYPGKVKPIEINEGPQKLPEIASPRSTPLSPHESPRLEHIDKKQEEKSGETQKPAEPNSSHYNGDIGVDFEANALPVHTLENPSTMAWAKSKVSSGVKSFYNSLPSIPSFWKKSGPTLPESGSKSSPEISMAKTEQQEKTGGITCKA